MSYYTQKSCQNPPVFACHLDDKKTRAPNNHFQLGISDSSFEGAEIIRLAPIVNRLLGQSLLLRIAENLLKFTSTQQSRKKILCEFLDADFPHKYR